MTRARVRAAVEHAAGVDRAALAAELRRTVQGEVRFDTQARALYATDASNFRHPPIGVVIPRTVDDVVATHAACHAHGAPIVARGCGTSLSGETVNVAVVIDFSKHLDRVLDIDPSSRTVRVQPGAINEQVNIACGRHNLVFGPDPSTHAYCTIGGNIGNNSCGTHSVQSAHYGPGPRTADNVAELEILTYDGLRRRVGPVDDAAVRAALEQGGRWGQIVGDLLALRDRHAEAIRTRLPQIPRRVSGYNLDELLPERGFDLARALVGTEGTCVTVLEATLRLTPAMLERALVVVGWDDIADAADHVPLVMSHRPIACEALDRVLFDDEMHRNIHPSELSELPQDANAWLLVEFGADERGEAEAQAERFCAAMRHGAGVRDDRIHVFADRAQERALWEVREGGLGATAFPEPGRDQWEGWEDSAVPPERVGGYLRDLRRLYERHGLQGAMYGHLGQGCIHSRISFDLRTPAGLRTYRRFLEDAADLVSSYGGSLSGEHGDGQQRAELLPRMVGEELVGAFRDFKRIWDPAWKMNPGKVVDPRPLDADLRLGTDYNPWRPRTVFAWTDDAGDVAHAALRCVGVGKCRTPQPAHVMCPSFMATRDEQHTTRGRARLLFEMLEGDIVQDGWASEAVHDALDLCLACKGCTADCPVHVDIPSFKAEFLHHHWQGRLRPRSAYAFGFVDRWAAVGSLAPGLVNAALAVPAVARALKKAGGVAQERELPRLAPQTLQAWFRARGGSHSAAGPGVPRVLLWPDTFTNRLHPAAGIAAVEALEAAGAHVVMPQGHVCCGRPLYDFGLLDAARASLRRSLAQLRAEIRAGTAVVGVEPSCLAVFRDELLKLLPHDDDAQRLARQSFHLAEWLRRAEVELPPLRGRALLWGHCHRRATGGMDDEVALLTDMGLEVDHPEGGCCGLAGSFGFEERHYGISMEIGELTVLPAVREAARTTAVVADGFSCRTQIEQGGTGRRPLHLAQLVALARERGPGALEEEGAAP